MDTYILFVVNGFVVSVYYSTPKYDVVEIKRSPTGMTTVCVPEIGKNLYQNTLTEMNKHQKYVPPYNNVVLIRTLPSTNSAKKIYKYKPLKTIRRSYEIDLIFFFFKSKQNNKTGND